MEQTTPTANKEQASLSLDPVVKAWLKKAGAVATIETGKDIGGSAIANEILKSAMIEAGDAEDIVKLRTFLKKRVLKK